MNRITYINTITSLSARFVLEVEGFNANNQYHINIHAENFLIPVLNEVFGLKLENLNATQKKNYPAIDLADFTNRVAFQITATSDFSKIKDTLKLFFEKGLNNQFDVLYFYILTQKKGNYSEDKIKDLVPSNFSFSAGENILDKDTFLQKINSISSTPKLQVIARHYEHEFSDVQIETRKHEFEGGYLNSEPEDLYPNMLRISFPDDFYKAELNIDEAGIVQRVNDWLAKLGKKPIKKMKKYKLVKRALKEMNASCDDWLLHEGCLITFRNLYDNNEPLRKIVDAGTITSLESKDYYSQDEDTNRVFKHLLGKTLSGLCKSRGIEWFAQSEVFRFANNPKHPNSKRVKWKGKKEATKTVIFEMINKKEGHIICYRNLAFRCSFCCIEDNWFIVLNPTWSFTNPGGYRQSRFESAYMSGIKRLENNNSVYNYFRFFGYYLSYSDLFTADYPYITISPAETVTFAPKLDEKVWNPVKVPEKPIVAPPAELKEDTELDINLFD